MIRTNADEFGKGLNAWSVQFKIGNDKAIRAVAQRLFENIVRRTPVDTGWARANWYASINRKITPAPGDVPEQFVGDAEAAVGSIAAVIATGKAGDVFWLQNGVPYITRLEEGTSQQAPEGMVAVSMAEVQAFFAQYAGAA